MTHLMQDSEDAQDRAKAIARYNAIKDGYEKVVENYRRNVPDGEIGEAIQQADRLAKEIFSTTDNELIPAIEAGDEEALERVNTKLEQLFYQHQVPLVDISRTIRSDTKNLESKAASKVASSITILLSNGFLVLLLSSILAYGLRLSIVRQENALQENKCKIDAINLLQLSSNSINLAISCLPTTFS